MKPKFFIYYLLLTSLAWNCTPDDAEQLTLKETETFAFAIDPQLEQETEQLLQIAYDGVNASLHQRAARRVVILPAGSVNGLANAIRAAGENGIVFVRTGNHTESSTVKINRSVTILGEKGAVLIVNTKPIPPAVPVQPALYIANAPDTRISGLHIRPSDSIGGIGILLQNSPRSKILQNQFTNHQFSIILEKSDESTVYFNTIITTSAWKTGVVGQAHGIINVNGAGVRIISNDVSNSLFGIWACGKNGEASSNYIHGNLIGLILCKVPPAALPLPDGTVVGSEFSATNWLTTNNNAVGNLDVGYLVIDGANGNTVTDNYASSNARVDYDIAGDSQRFGFFTPKAFNNNITIRGNQTVKDCGVNTTIIGGVRINTTAVPCF